MASEVRADTPSSRASAVERIVVVGEPSHAVSRLLQAELTADGWTVVLLDSRILTNEQLEKEYGAVAVLRTDMQAQTVSVWVAADGRRNSYRELIVGKSEAAPVLAIRAVEVLRAHLLTPRQLRDAPPPAVPPPEPRASAPTPPEANPVLLVQFAPAMGYSPGGLGLRPEASLALELAYLDFLSTSIGAVLPLRATRKEGLEGAADLSPYVFHASLAYSTRISLWRFGAGVGGAFSYVRMEGQQATPNFVVADDPIQTGGPIARVFSSVELFPRVSLRAEVLVGANLQRTVVQFDKRLVAYWGQPFGTLSLGLELGL